MTEMIVDEKAGRGRFGFRGLVRKGLLVSSINWQFEIQKF
jgi:hypothetical protein